VLLFVCVAFRILRNATLASSRLLVCWSVRLFVCWTVGLLDFRSVGLLDFRSDGLLDCWYVGLLDFRSVGLDCNWNDFNDMIFRYCFENVVSKFWLR
jgi:hypothetical protein